MGFGFTGIGGPEGIGIDAVNNCVPAHAGKEQAKLFWWATILRAASRVAGDPSAKLPSFQSAAANWEAREDILGSHEKDYRRKGISF